LNSCSNSIVKNNLAFDNFGFAWDVTGSEQDGFAYAYGARLKTSPACEVSNNTLYRNWAKINNFASLDPVICGQVYVSYSSTNGIVKNNICESYHTEAYSMFVSDSSQAGLISDYNDLYSHNQGSAGVWGTHIYRTLLSWKTNSGRDTNSLGVDPVFYDVSATNFHLAYNSPLIDAGQNLSTVQEDGDSEARPIAGHNGSLLSRQDIGYDEFVDSDGDGLADIIEKTLTHTNPNEPDTDHDGLPDGWEVANGLDPNDSNGVNGASGDPDGDGYTNMQEYLGGSNPRLTGSVPAQPPLITAFSPSGSSLFILEEDNTVFFATATDANNDPLHYAWKLDGAQVSTNSSWTFATTDTDSGQTTLSKQYTVQLVVAAGSDQVSRQWTVVVNNRNHAPVLNLMSNITAKVGDTIHLTPVYYDPDNQNSATGDDNILTVTYSGWMTNATKTIGTGDRGLHFVTVTVTDNGNPALSAEQTIQVAVDVPVLVSPALAGAIQRIGATNYFTVTYIRPKPSTNAVYILEATTNLVNWTVSSNYTSLVTDNGPSETVVLRDTAPLSATNKRFMRLKVTGR
jgi:hypothetical protein